MAIQQMARKEDASTLLTNEDKTHIQKIVGTLLYYARAVNPKMLVYLVSIAVNQAKINEKTAQEI